MRLIVVLLAGLLTLVGCSKNEPVAEAPKQAKEEPLKEYALKGQVKRLDTQGKIATIQHEQIGDWMGAMTMEFPVKDAADFAKLSEGKPVSATVYVQGLNYWVANVQDTPEPTKK
jgi:Cu/Ag efflux protein CusF